MTNIKLSNTLLLTGYSNKHLIDDVPDHDTSSFQKGDQFNDYVRFSNLKFRKTLSHKKLPAVRLKAIKCWHRISFIMAKQKYATIAKTPAKTKSWHILTRIIFQKIMRRSWPLRILNLAMCSSIRKCQNFANH